MAQKKSASAIILHRELFWTGMNGMAVGTSKGGCGLAISSMAFISISSLQSGTGGFHDKTALFTVGRLAGWSAVLARAGWV
jgi:hypothetical protein